MKRNIITVFATLFAVSAMAEATIEGVIVRQQWPWNNKVNVDFVLADPEGFSHDLNIVFKNGETVLNIEDGALSGDLRDVMPGIRRIVWDPSAISEKVLQSLTATITVADDPKKFMVLDLSGGSSVASVPVSFASHPPKGGWAADPASYTTKLVLRRIDAGTYTVGSPASEVGRVERHEPLRQVTLTKGYYLALFPTTNKQYELMAGARPEGSTSSDDSPAYKVSLAMLRGKNSTLLPAKGGSWPKPMDGSFFANFNARVSLGDDLAGYQFDVPSGAQWEIACRAGTTNTWYNGLDNDSSIPDFAAKLQSIARYDANRGASTVVTTRQPNPWGFYDFIGNTREWVRDFFHEEISIEAWQNEVSPIDGVVWRYYDTTAACYTRGGYEWCYSSTLRTAQWTFVDYGVPTGLGHDDHEQGFRIVCTYLQ